MSEAATRDWLLCLAVIALLWTLAATARPAYVIEGTIASTRYRNYPWQFGPRFDLLVRTLAGRELWFRGLRGECVGPGRQFSRCTKPELPVGATIRLVINGFTDPNSCEVPAGFRRIGVPCFRSLDRIAMIEVDRRPVVAGWHNPAAVYLFYALIVVGAAILAFNGWHPGRVSIGTVAVYSAVAATCLFAGYAYY